MQYPTTTGFYHFSVPAATCDYLHERMTAALATGYAQNQIVLTMKKRSHLGVGSSYQLYQVVNLLRDQELLRTLQGIEAQLPQRELLKDCRIRDAALVYAKQADSASKLPIHLMIDQLCHLTVLVVKGMLTVKAIEGAEELQLSQGKVGSLSNQGSAAMHVIDDTMVLCWYLTDVSEQVMPIWKLYALV